MARCRSTIRRRARIPPKEGNDVASSTDVRPKITLACEVCKHRNYITKKNRRNDPDRLEIRSSAPTAASTRRTKNRADERGHRRRCPLFHLSTAGRGYCSGLDCDRS